MEDKYLEQLLVELGNEDMNLPLNLVKNTKEKINHRYFVPIISLSIFLNLLSLVSLVIVVYLKFRFRGLISLYILWSFICSLSILPIIIFIDRYKLKSIINDRF